MENQKESCEKLYNKYKKLKEETKIDGQGQDITKSIGEFNASISSSKKMIEKNRIKKELRNKCKSFLSPEQNFKLEED